MSSTMSAFCPKSHLKHSPHALRPGHGPVTTVSRLGGALGPGDMMRDMPGTNLTRDEAAARASLLDVTSYSIDLDLTTGDTTFASTTTIRFTLPRARRGDLRRPGRRDRPRDHAERRAARPRRRRTPTAGSALTGLAADNELVVRADCTYSRTGEGLHRFVDPADDRVYLYSQFEVPDARRVFTTFEQPDLKAPFTFHVTAPSHWKVVSNAADARRPRTSASGTVGLAVPRDQADVDVHHRARRRRVPRGPRHLRGQARRHPARPLLPPVAGRAPRRRGAGEAHPAGLRVLRGRRSTTPTRSASTTSSTCRSTTWARWRTPAA